MSAVFAGVAVCMSRLVSEGVCRSQLHCLAAVFARPGAAGCCRHCGLEFDVGMAGGSWSMHALCCMGCLRRAGDGKHRCRLLASASIVENASTAPH